MDNGIEGATARSREKQTDRVRDRVGVYLTLRREGRSSASHTPKHTHIHTHIHIHAHTRLCAYTHTVLTGRGSEPANREPADQ